MTYLCETTFSAVTAMKSIYRAKLDIENDIHMCFLYWTAFRHTVWCQAGTLSKLTLTEINNELN